MRAIVNILQGLVGDKSELLYSGGAYSLSS